MAIPALNAVVTRRVKLSQDLFILRIAPEGWELPEFKPGQFAVIGLPPTAPRTPLSDPEETPPPADKMVRRAYSIASSSLARQYLEFYVVMVKTGALTPRLFALQPGDPVWLSPKITGMMTLDDLPEGVNVVMLSTGTGLAPYMSMLRTHITDGKWNRVAVLHGARQSYDLGYSDELEMMDRLHDNMTYIPTISRPKNEHMPWRGEVGYVQDLWKRRVLSARWGVDPTPGDTHIYLCGNPGMIDATMEVLTADGFVEHTRKTPGQVHVERYW